MKTLSIYVFAIGLFLVGGNAINSIASPPTQEGAYALHGYPYGKTAYASRAEWPLVSAQGHWSPANPMGMVGHTHVECWAPVWAELPRQSFDLPCRIQLFHVEGEIWGGTYGVFADLSEIIWDNPAPVVGDPNGLVIRNFTVRVNQDALLPNGSGGPLIPVPQRGWYVIKVSAFTVFDNGNASTRTALHLPFYANGDPTAAEVNPFVDLAGFQYQLASHVQAFTVDSGGQFGVSSVEFNDAQLPILSPVAARTIVTGQAFSYARHPDLYPGGIALDRIKQINDLDLHNGVPGTTVLDIGGNAAIPVPLPAVFDPAIGQGVHKTAMTWEQSTGAGGGTFAPNEMVSSLLVVNWTAGSVVPPPPPPVNCTGSFVKTQTGPLTWIVEFVVTTPASNGGTCTPSFTIGG